MIKFNKCVLFRIPYSSLVKIHEKYKRTPSIYLASQDLYRENTEKSKKSLLKYHIRSCTRCTPFATFAGCFIAEATNRTELIRKTEFKQFVRIDTNFISQIISFIDQLDNVKTQLNFSLNNSLYSVFDTYRYTEFSSVNNSKKYHLSEINRLKSIDYWYSQKTIQAYSEYIEDIMLIENVEIEDAKMLIEQLIQNQILVSELEPCVTGVEPLNQIVSILNRIENVEPIKNILNEIVSLIETPQYNVKYYQSIENKIKDIIPNLTVPKNTLQVDMFIHTDKSTISKDWITELKKQVIEMMVLNRTAQNQDLENFKKEFYKKYEQSKMPLALVLDAEAGIGYSGIGSSSESPLIDDLFLGSPNPSSSSSVSHDNITEFSKKKYLKWVKNKLNTIEVTEDDLKPFESQKNKKFPVSMALFGAIQKVNDSNTNDDFQFEMYSLGGASGANLLGRFAMGNSDIESLCKSIVEKEEATNPDVIFAEIAHLPEARMGNILLRPCFRKYEIIYVGKSGLPRENQIDISDLMIYIEAGEIVLWSQKHNKRVMPRLSTAHNFSRGLPIYKFLCDLQMQGYSYPCIWDWGVFSNEKFLPRVIYKNIVWQKARWIIEINDIKDLPKEKEKWIVFFVEFRNIHTLPQQILYSQGDNNLLIDFENIDMLDILVDYIQKYKKITLVEFLFNKDNCIIHDEEGMPYTNEVIIPFEYEQDEK
jgi:hypothetical protein